MSNRYRHGGVHVATINFDFVGLCGKLLILLCAFLAPGRVADAAQSDSYPPSITLNPVTARALVEAIHSFDCKGEKPPYCLSRYTVLLVQHETSVEVVFQANEGHRSLVAIVPNGGRAYIDTSGTSTIDVPPIVVPGTTSGALAMAWARIGQAVGGTAILGKLSRVEVYIEPGTTIVAFLPQLPPTNVRCIGGNCDSRWGYRISIDNGKVTIQP
jgi:hypothetical protein